MTAEIQDQWQEAADYLTRASANWRALGANAEDAWARMSRVQARTAGGTSVPMSWVDIVCALNLSVLHLIAYSILHHATKGRKP